MSCGCSACQICNTVPRGRAAHQTGGRQGRRTWGYLGRRSLGRPGHHTRGRPGCPHRSRGHAGWDLEVARMPCMERGGACGLVDQGQGRGRGRGPQLYLGLQFITIEYFWK